MMQPRKKLLRVLAGEQIGPPPIWLMRQAGRYLPEYRQVRAEAGSFLDLCFTPELAVEVTLQPIRRFGFDAAILFSDILVVPHALGQKLWFEDGKGPCLEALETPGDLSRLSAGSLHESLRPVYETISRLRGELPGETALIGFAGAPWTVASYMLEGGSTREFLAAKRWLYGKPQAFAKLIELLIEVTADYLVRQVEAGAEALQLFDSWAGVLSAPALRRWCLEPARQIVARVKQKHPEVPIILFPRGAGLLYREFLACGADALSLDTSVPLGWARGTLQGKLAVQGNLDPALLVVGGRPLAAGVELILKSLGGGPFIFNLGHGITPQADPANVARLVELVRNWRPEAQGEVDAPGLSA